MCITNLEYFLQAELINFPSIKISYSVQYDNYDYCTNIFKIISDDKLEELKNFLETNKKINDIFDWCFVISKQSFLNFKIKKLYLVNWLKEICEKKFIEHNDYNFEQLTNISFISKISNPKKILYDYSSPNLAKDMHVGHLRSTIIGDALANISEYIGHEVTRVNHFGDFGLPFGMIVEYIISKNITIDENTSLQNLYRLSKNCFETDSQFNSNSYIRTAELQMKTNQQTVQIWNTIYNYSLISYQEIYDTLNISKKLQPIGESYYLQYIDQVKELLKFNNMILLDKNGRTVVNISNGNNKNIIPMIYEKSEQKCSSYTYDTTDIVTLWYRTQILNQDEIYYVVDSGQSLHFKQLIQVGEQMNWSINKKIQHVNFGIITNASGTRIASRTGNTHKLLDLINDGIETARLESLEKNNNVDIIDEETIKNIAIGSIKYFDLSKTRTMDYVFNYDLMLKFNFNSYTYIAYCMSRCRGIKDKFLESNGLLSTNINYSTLEDPDFTILKKILLFPIILEKVLETKMPHLLCTYMNELCNSLHYGYTNTRCLNFDNDNNLINYNESRILLYTVSSLLLENICNLLGLPIIKKI